MKNYLINVASVALVVGLLYLFSFLFSLLIVPKEAQFIEGREWIYFTFAFLFFMYMFTVVQESITNVISEFKKIDEASE